MRNRLWCATTHSLIKLFTVERWGHDIDKVGSFSILFSGQQQSLGPIKDAVWDHVLYYWYVLLHYPSASKLHATCIIVAVGSSQIILPKQNLEGICYIIWERIRNGFVMFAIQSIDPCAKNMTHLNWKILLIKSSEKYFISLPAFYLIMWLMISPKNFEKIVILKIWQLVFFWGVKIHFGKLES